MRYELRLTAYDMLDQVHVSALCYSTPEDMASPSAQVLAMTTTVQGVGTPTAREWTQEALIAMLEAL